MLDRIKKLDHFTKNVILVFIASTAANFFNLLYQLLIAHKLSLSDFASANSLLSISMLFSAPLGTIQLAVAKYTAEFSAQNQISKVKFFLSDMLLKALGLAALTLVILISFSAHLTSILKISSTLPGYILAFLVASAWFCPIFLGGVQGLELFKWFSLGSVAMGILRLGFAAIFIIAGYSVSGALGAILASSLIGFVILYFPLKDFISLKAEKEQIDYKEIFFYLFPLAISNLCFIWLVSFDMVLVKYFFSENASGAYSLAQMVGKIFLFLPAAVSVVMFPKTSGLSATNNDTLGVLKKSLCYAIGICLMAIFIYNLMPVVILTILTGKALPESVALGRLFSLSMTFFALSYVLINYLLSIKDLSFIKYLILSTCLQGLGIFLFHQNLFQVQIVICVNAVCLFSILLFLAYKKNFVSSKVSAKLNLI